jgi:small subunit ribosomal protein S18
MARNNDRNRDRGPKRVVRDNRFRGKKRVCIFCQERTAWVDYKDVNLLRRFISDRGKIRSRRVTGNCAQHQREVQVAIKTAREIALLPYSQRTLSERSPVRGPRGARENDAVGGRSDSDGNLEDIQEMVALDDGPDAVGRESDEAHRPEARGVVRQLQESEV